MKRELVQALFVLALVLVLLGLELVEALLVSILFVLVILLSALHLDVMSLCHLADLLLVHALHVLLALEQLVIAVLVLDLLVLNLSHQLSNLLVLAVKFLLGGSLLVLLGDLDLVLQVLDVRLELVALLLLNQDLVRLNNLAVLLVLLLGILVGDLEDSEDTILSGREQVVVILRHSQPFDRQTMSLDLENLLEVEVNDLDGSRLVVLSDTSEQGSSAVEQLDLRDVHASLVSHDQLASIDRLNSLVDTCGIYDRLGLGLISYTGELEVLDHEGMLGVNILRIILVSVELPDEHVTVPTSGNEAGVVILPVEAPHRAQMSFVDHVLGVFTSIELIDINVTL
mmetsp:Transcript_4420/g.6465  ORF Transcript_4420/g.6465 Transcript_4420/m.6465 type:complete len:341 (+) Transcript_4420:1506-2528(+)